MIAALFVSERGPYTNLPGVDAWTAERDARLYAGPWPVVAHPPCERWGRYFWGGPGWKGEPKKLGDDGGCFAAALAAVRTWGGVLEHPAGSRAWQAFGLRHPPRVGGWVAAGDFLGWTCCVDQGHYGHLAPKASWLYAVGVSLPSLRWRPSTMKLEPQKPLWEPCGDCDEFWCNKHRQHAFECPCPPIEELGFDPYVASRRRGTRSGNDAVERLSRKARAETPRGFLDLLLSIARTAKVGGNAVSEARSDEHGYEHVSKCS